MAVAEPKTWREVNAGSTGDTIDLKKSAYGTILEGTYLGSRTITTTLGENKIFTFETEDGPTGVYGFTDLTSKMAEVQNGADVRLTYLGKEEITSKKRGTVLMHKVRVEVA
jgi:hypothetical protein